MSGTLKEDIKRPINLIMLIIAFISIVLSYYFFTLSQKDQRPTYLVYNEVSKIFDSNKNSSKLILLNQNSEPIKKDVYLVTLAFWNSGKLPIEPQDIRRDINFSITNCEEIIDYNVIYQTNPDATKFFLVRGENKRTLVLRWNHLDPNNGAKFQVFYIGSSNPICKFTGNVLGNNKILNGEPWLSQNSLIAVASSFTMVILCIIYITVIVRIKKFWIFILGMIILAGLSIGSLTFLKSLGSLEPPFKWESNQNESVLKMIPHFM